MGQGGHGGDRTGDWLLIACPTCDAPPQQRCRAKRLNRWYREVARKHPHRARWREALRTFA